MNANGLTISDKPKEYKGKVKFLRVDVDQNYVDDYYEIGSYPAYQVVLKGRTLKTLSGSRSYENFKKAIEKYLPKRG